MRFQRVEELPEDLAALCLYLSEELQPGLPKLELLRRAGPPWLALPASASSDGNELYVYPSIDDESCVFVYLKGGYVSTASC